MVKIERKVCRGLQGVGSVGLTCLVNGRTVTGLRFVDQFMEFILKCVCVCVCVCVYCVCVYGVPFVAKLCKSVLFIYNVYYLYIMCIIYI